MKFIIPMLLWLYFFTLSCNKNEIQPKPAILQQKLYNCLFPNARLPKKCWILLSGGEFTLMDFIVLNPLSSDSITSLSCKLAIADTNYIDKKNEFIDNCKIINDITGQVFKVFFTIKIQKDISKKEIQFNTLLKNAKRVGDSPCIGFDPKSTSLTEIENRKFIKISACKNSKHPVQTFYDNITKALRKVK